MQQARNSALKEKADAEKELKCYQDKKAEIDQQIQNVDQQKQEAQAAADEAIRAKLVPSERQRDRPTDSQIWKIIEQD